jgi:cation diffusion facilitator family transporter
MEKGKEKKFVSLVNLAGNIFLFLIKIFIGVLTGSIALIADSLNSLSDIFSSLIALIAVKISGKKPDTGHPFGHQRAESIAGLIIGILVAVIGIEIAKEGILKLISGNSIQFGFLALIVLAITIAVKLLLAFYTKITAKKTKSMALTAVSEDSKMDVLISVTALIGVFGAVNGFPFLDPLIAMLISVYVVWTGIKIAMQNSNLLIGKAPSKKLIEKIKKRVLEVEGVKGMHEIRAQYLGILVQVELHVVVNEKLSIQQAHSIGKNVQYALEAMEEIDRVFIHLDPFKASYFWNDEKLSGKK